MPSTTKPTYGKPHLGCYFDHANYNNDELSRKICQLAQGYGWTPDAEGLALLALRLADLSDDDSQNLSELSDEATDWLNGCEVRPFMFWGNDGEAGAFGLWVNVEGAREECEFVTSKAQEYPDKDFWGQWLHVSDHGNATLYLRDEVGNDTEIWGVV